MSEASGGGAGQDGATTSHVVRIPNGTPEKKFNGLSINRMVRILRSSGTNGKVGPGSSCHGGEPSTGHAVAPADQSPEETSTGSSKFARMVRRLITHKRVSYAIFIFHGSHYYEYYMQLYNGQI